MDGADSSVMRDDRQRPIAFRMCFGDGRFKVAQPLGRIGATGHDDFDGRADYIRIPSLREPSLHAVGCRDAARIVFLQALQVHQVGAKRECLWRDERFRWLARACVISNIFCRLSLLQNVWY
jgi:hypothetical protein